MRLSLMCRSCCCASCMCRRFWRTSPLPSMALCKASTHHCKTQPRKPRKTLLIKAHADAGKLTCCAFPRVRRAVVRGGLRNGRLVWRPYFPGHTNKQQLRGSALLSVHWAHIIADPSHTRAGIFHQLRANIPPWRFLRFRYHLDAGNTDKKN